MPEETIVIAVTTPFVNVAVADAGDAELVKVTVGVVKYPDPPFTIVTDVTVPVLLSNSTVPVAVSCLMVSTTATADSDPVPP